MLTAVPTTVKLTARQLAKQAADRYFAALAADLPFDTAPGDVNLVQSVTEIQDALMTERTAPDAEDTGFREDTAFRAGYLLGVEIGRRMGGAR